ALNYRLIAASRDKLAADPEAAALFLPGGQPVPVGARLVQPRLAALLDAIARDGAAAFYTGPVAARVAAKVRGVGGLLDSADFAAYRPEFRRPLCSEFRGHAVLGAPPPVSGATIAEVLNLAERAELPRYGDPTRDAAATVRLADAIRVALTDREQLRGHPDWARGPARGVASAAFAATRTSLVGAPVRDTIAMASARAYETAALPAPCAPIDAYEAMPAPAPQRSGEAAASADPATVGSETSHLVAIDGAGNAVSLTSSVGVLFGSGVYAEGIFLNSSGNLFSPGQRAPRRKPASGLSPTILLRDGRVRAAAGAGGAAYIPTAVAQVLYRLVGLGQDPWLALAAPRLHPTADGVGLEIEQGFALDAYAALRAHGYLPSNRVANLQFAGVHAAVVRDDGTIVGAADPRRDGAAIGW
ncbi:MAG: gamma-glutamyltransferase, partial [Gemmatimonadaceae bacterium]